MVRSLLLLMMLVAPGRALEVVGVFAFPVEQAPPLLAVAFDDGGVAFVQRDAYLTSLAPPRGARASARAVAIVADGLASGDVDGSPPAGPGDDDPLDPTDPNDPDPDGDDGPPGPLVPTPKDLLVNPAHAAFLQARGFVAPAPEGPDGSELANPPNGG